LESLKALAPKRLLVVFGCGGDRDRGKRPLMAREAGRLADLCLLTSDNPRTEDPLGVIKEAAAGLTALGLRPLENGRASRAELEKAGAEDKTFVVEPDRAAAIKLAVALMAPGDILLVAGKGHETYQIVGRERRPFDDRQEALKALTALGRA
jgi:UDP-N-acetylmuramyl tripeptide synthase